MCFLSFSSTGESGHSWQPRRSGSLRTHNAAALGTIAWVASLSLLAIAVLAPPVALLACIFIWVPPALLIPAVALAEAAFWVSWAAVRDRLDKTPVVPSSSHDPDKVSDRLPVGGFKLTLLGPRLDRYPSSRGTLLGPRNLRWVEKKSRGVGDDVLNKPSCRSRLHSSCRSSSLFCPISGRDSATLRSAIPTF